MPFIFLFLITVFFSPVSAETLTLFNVTDKPLYVGLYYQSIWNKNAKIIGASVAVQPKRIEKFSRPPFKANHDRILVVTNKNELLKPQLLKKDLQQLTHTIIGLLGNYLYFVTEHNNKLAIYTEQEWKIVGTLGAIKEKIFWVVAGFTGPINAWISQQALATYKSSFSLLLHEPFITQTAHVKIGNTLSEQEQKATQKRLGFIQDKMNAKFGPKTKVPKIALIASGGGYRAMFGFLGALMGMQKTGLYDFLLWISSISGSSWLLASYTSYNAMQKTISAAAFKNMLVNEIVNKNFCFKNKQEATLFSNALIAQALIRQPITLITLWGNLLANRIFGMFGIKKQTLYLSQQASLVEKGIMPIPIYSAINGEETGSAYEWYEFTPWEVGSSWLNCFVPSWGFGRSFDQGITTSFMGTKTLAFNIGAWGAAFAARVEEGYECYKNELPSDVARTIVEKTIVRPMGQKRLTWAEVDNFSYGIAQSPLKDKKTIQLIDAGIAINLGYPPISGERPERKADIIIALDFSEIIGQEGALKNVISYAKRKNLSLPPIDLTAVNKQSLSIFKNEDPQTPVVIYIPRLLDERLKNKLNEPMFASYRSKLQNFDIQKCVSQDYCKTSNFIYSKQQAEQLIAFGDFLMQALASDIFAEIEKNSKK